MIHVHVIAIDPPFRSDHGVLFGLQDKRGHVDPFPATGTTTFETEIEPVRVDDGDLDFRGVHVHGRKGDRFLYLSWGTGDPAEPFVMSARAKIKLADIPAEFVSPPPPTGLELECHLQATNAKGQPATGTIKPPAVTWRRRT